MIERSKMTIEMYLKLMSDYRDHVTNVHVGDVGGQLYVSVNWNNSLSDERGCVSGTYPSDMSPNYVAMDMDRKLGSDIILCLKLKMRELNEKLREKGDDENVQTA